jgi:hypothetical protein
LASMALPAANRQNRKRPEARGTSRAFLFVENFGKLF